MWAVPERPGVERTPPIPRRRKRCARIALQPGQNRVGGFSCRSGCRGKISVVETLSGDSEPPTPPSYSHFLVFLRYPVTMFDHFGDSPKIRFFGFEHFERPRTHFELGSTSTMLTQCVSHLLSSSLPLYGTFPGYLLNGVRSQGLYSP